MSGWEGLGGPVNVNRPDVSDLDFDPTLSACCRREVESNRQRTALDSTLRRHDVVAQAEQRRRDILNLIQNMSFGKGCRCCYDPNSDGGEYRSLMEAREKVALEEQQESAEQTNEEHTSNVEDEDAQQEASEDDSDDDEFDYLLNEDYLAGEEDNNKALKEIEDRRRAELELVALHQEAAQQHGYGTHRQMHPTRVLRAAGLGGGSSAETAPPGVVLHLVDPDSTTSASLDLYLEKLAETNRGTKFLRSEGRSTLLLDAELARTVLPARWSPERDMPTLVAIRDGVVVATCPSLHGLAHNEKINPSAVKDWLEHAGVLIRQPPAMEELCGIRPEEMALYDNDLPSRSNENNKPPEGEPFDCGMPGCHKHFPHEHVGVKNEQQNGLIVQEREVVTRDTEPGCDE